METATRQKDFFILYKPKDIVSGDFYFALSHQATGKNNEIFYFCTADCTGHGVPGALMSMLGISKLNESIIEKNLVHPNEILDNTRLGIIASLNPEGSDVESRDGMDCVLCAFDFKNMKLEFAAANNPLWHLRNGKITEYKADKMPVGKESDTLVPFTLQQIDLERGDVIYTFTDGYADQFGGPKGKKFKYKQFEEVILANSTKSLEEQKSILDSTIENWRGTLEQIDDILVVAFKI